MATIGEIFSAGLKAVGYDTNSKEFVDWINQPAVMGVNVNEQNALAELQDKFFTFKEAIETKAIQDKIMGSKNDEFKKGIHGSFMEIIESTTGKTLREMGATDADFASRLRSEPDLVKKVQMIMTKAGEVSKGPGGDETEKVKALQKSLDEANLKISGMDSDYEGRLRAKDDEIAGIKKTHETQAIRTRVMNNLRGQFKFIDGAEKYTVPGILDEHIYQKYHVKEEGGTVTLYEKDNPEVLATDQNGQIKFEKVIESAIPQSLLKTQNPGGGGGIPPITGGGTGNGGPDLSKMSPRQKEVHLRAKAEAEQIRQMSGG